MSIKNKILGIAENMEIQVKIETERLGFDMTQYEIYHKDNFEGVFVYYTGETSNGISYDNSELKFWEDINDTLLNIYLRYPCKDCQPQCEKYKTPRYDNN